MKTLDKLNQNECKYLLIVFSDKEKIIKDKLKELNLNRRDINDIKSYLYYRFYALDRKYLYDTIKEYEIKSNNILSKMRLQIVEFDFSDYVKGE